MRVSRARIGDPAVSFDDTAEVESRIIDAHVRLALQPACERGRRTVAIARFGAFEVRMTELLRNVGTGIPAL